MTAVTWNKELSVGISDVDDEHKKLVGIFNELDEAMRTGMGTRIMDDVLTRLLDYTVYHFESEEQLMKDSEYPDLHLHQALHSQLVEKLGTLQRKFRSSGHRITREMMDLLKYWLTNHIQVDDMAFGKFHKGRSMAGAGCETPAD